MPSGCHHMPSSSDRTLSKSPRSQIDPEVETTWPHWKSGRSLQHWKKVNSLGFECFHTNKISFVWRRGMSRCQSSWWYQPISDDRSPYQLRYSLVPHNSYIHLRAYLRAWTVRLLSAREQLKWILRTWVLHHSDEAVELKPCLIRGWNTACPKTMQQFKTCRTKTGGGGGWDFTQVKLMICFSKDYSMFLCTPMCSTKWCCTSHIAPQWTSNGG